MDAERNGRCFYFEDDPAVQSTGRSSNSPFDRSVPDLAEFVVRVEEIGGPDASSGHDAHACEDRRSAAVSIGPAVFLRAVTRCCRGKWSGRLDSNQRPSAPKADALPGCATPRLSRCSILPQMSAGRGSASVASWRELQAIVNAEAARRKPDHGFGGSRMTVRLKPDNYGAFSYTTFPRNSVISHVRSFNASAGTV
jgi:hypothetical protein